MPLGREQERVEVRDLGPVGVRLVLPQVLTGQPPEREIHLLPVDRFLGQLNGCHETGGEPRASQSVGQQVFWLAGGCRIRKAAPLLRASQELRDNTSVDYVVVLHDDQVFGCSIPVDLDGIPVIVGRASDIGVLDREAVIEIGKRLHRFRQQQLVGVPTENACTIRLSGANLAALLWPP
jgi:hypothetical protein